MKIPSLNMNRIGGIIVSMLTSKVVDRGFEPQSGQTKHAALRRKSKDWLARNQNESE